MGLTNSRTRQTMDDNDSTESTDSVRDIVSVLQYLIRENNVNMRVLNSDDEDDYGFDGKGNYLDIDPSDPVNKIEGSELQQDILNSSGRPPKSLRDNSTILRMINEREFGMFGAQQFTRGNRCLITSRFLPNTPHVVQHYSQKAFCGTYSEDGELFLTACQDRRLRLYRTKDHLFEPFKSIEARDVGWSILDTAFSPDGNYFIYSSWSECIHLCSIYQTSEKHLALPLCPEYRRFCIFSLTFSQDGQEVLGGANDGCLYVYDINGNARILKISAHDDDVNTVAFADATSQILFSGGDDGLCKVWDRRTLDESHPKPVGILAGHMNGITFVDTRGDGRHLITNCKDQTIKLWDMRVFSPAVGLENTKRAVNSGVWDYRWQSVPKNVVQRNRAAKLLKGDTSLMTYTGHSVQQTLIRSRFSPVFTTSQQYIYTGCSTGRVIIYDVLTGNKVKELKGHRTCVRDVSWHPWKPDIVSTSWDGTIVYWNHEEEDDDDDDDTRDYLRGALKDSTSKRMKDGSKRSSRYDFRRRSRQSYSS